MRVLVVEDEKKLASFIRRALKEDGHAVDVCNDGDMGLLRATGEECDAVILDLMLPGRSGLEILRAIRDQGKSTPVLILTARDSLQDRITGLDRGADDYLTKPFALDELRARVRALLRRNKGGISTILKFSDLQMDLVERTVVRGKRAIEMTPKEFSLLEFFLRNPRRVLTRTSIAEHVWDYNFDWQSNVVDVFVNGVRRKLEEGNAPRLIHTRRGVGYVLKEDEDADD